MVNEVEANICKVFVLYNKRGKCPSCDSFSNLLLFNCQVFSPFCQYSFRLPLPCGYFLYRLIGISLLKRPRFLDGCIRIIHNIVSVILLKYNFFIIYLSRISRFLHIACRIYFRFFPLGIDNIIWPVSLILKMPNICVFLGLSQFTVISFKL